MIRRIGDIQRDIMLARQCLPDVNSARYHIDEALRLIDVMVEMLDPVSDGLDENDHGDPQEPGPSRGNRDPDHGPR